MGGSPPVGGLPPPLGAPPPIGWPPTGPVPPVELATPPLGPLAPVLGLLALAMSGGGRSPVEGEQPAPRKKAIRAPHKTEPKSPALARGNVAAFIRLQLYQ